MFRVGKKNKQKWLKDLGNNNTSGKRFAGRGRRVGLEGSGMPCIQIQEEGTICRKQPCPALISKLCWRATPPAMVVKGNPTTVRVVGEEEHDGDVTVNVSWGSLDLWLVSTSSRLNKGQCKRWLHLQQKTPSFESCGYLICPRVKISFYGLNHTHFPPRLKRWLILMSFIRPSPLPKLLFPANLKGGWF